VLQQTAFYVVLSVQIRALSDISGSWQLGLRVVLTSHTHVWSRGLSYGWVRVVLTAYKIVPIIVVNAIVIVALYYIIVKN
jgi:hypothetical protein